MTSALMRTEWLVLADQGSFPDPQPDPSAPTATVVTVVSEPDAFREALVERRPRVAVMFTPPGGPAEMELLVAERHRRPSLRAVLVNERSGVAERLQALRRGLDEALDRELDPAEVHERLRILAGRVRRGRDEHRLTIADGLVLDLETRELRRGGKPIHLRPKEFGLLEMLARQHGRAMSRQQLVDRVWGREPGRDERTVDVHVRWLRQKVEVEPDQPVRLLTVRGVGYRLICGPLTADR